MIALRISGINSRRSDPPSKVCCRLCSSSKVPTRLSYSPCFPVISPYALSLSLAALTTASFWIDRATQPRGTMSTAITDSANDAASTAQGFFFRIRRAVLISLGNNVVCTRVTSNDCSARPSGTENVSTLSWNSVELSTFSPMTACSVSARSTSYCRLCCRNFCRPASLKPLPQPSTRTIFASRLTLEK